MKAFTALLTAALATAAALVVTPAAQAAPTSATAVADQLLPGQRLKSGQFIRSKNGVYTLRMANTGTVQLLKNGFEEPLWSSWTYRPGSVLVLSKTGTLDVIYGRTKISSIGPKNAPNAKLVLPDTGNLTILNTAGKAVWNRHMVIETLWPSFMIHAGDANGRDLVMYSQNRIYTLQMRTDGNLVLLKNGKTVLWSTGTKSGWTAGLLSDGTFETLNLGGDSVWRIETRSPGTILQLSNTGGLRLIYGRTVVEVLH
ncbi:hypothetical protein [Kribbella ginsengisoli]|uniref:Bulb-type lectin domain-containing protein n=1 Tax=Kribbella ginsengisoli TaxID=363865 RepID=A0ABP6XY79_9ACTN